MSDRLQVLSAGISFFAILSIAPVLVTALSVYGAVNTPQQALDQLSRLTGLLEPSRAVDIAPRGAYQCAHAKGKNALRLLVGLESEVDPLLGVPLGLLPASRQELRPAKLGEYPRHRALLATFLGLLEPGAHLVGLGEWDEGRDEALAKEIDAAVRAAQKEAEKLGILPEQGFEDIPSMFDDVYAEIPWHIAEQREQALAEAREYQGRDSK